MGRSARRNERGERRGKAVQRAHPDARTGTMLADVRAWWYAERAAVMADLRRGLAAQAPWPHFHAVPSDRASSTSAAEAAAACAWLQAQLPRWCEVLEFPYPWRLEVLAMGIGSVPRTRHWAVRAQARARAAAAQLRDA
jgi:hypothetical protein